MVCGCSVCWWLVTCRLRRCRQCYVEHWIVIMNANCPIYWASKLQTKIALSTAEAEYTALSQALREVIPLMTLMEEIHPVFPVHITQPKFVCKVHEDNQSYIKMAKSDKFIPKTKHIALKYHHFKAFVKQDRITIDYCRTEDQKLTC